MEPGCVQKLVESIILEQKKFLCMFDEMLNTMSRMWDVKSNLFSTGHEIPQRSDEVISKHEEDVQQSNSSITLEQNQEG